MKNQRAYWCQSLDRAGLSQSCAAPSGSQSCSQMCDAITQERVRRKDHFYSCQEGPASTAAARVRGAVTPS